jgi:hypothetical protein
MFLQFRKALGRLAFMIQIFHQGIILYTTSYKMTKISSKITFIIPYFRKLNN